MVNYQLAVKSGHLPVPLTTRGCLCSRHCRHLVFHIVYIVFALSSVERRQSWPSDYIQTPNYDLYHKRMGGGCMTYLFLTRPYESVSLLPCTWSKVVLSDSSIKADCSCVLQLLQQQPLQEAHDFGTQIPGK